MFAATWVNLEEIMLNTISQTQRTSLYDSTCLCHTEWSNAQQQEVAWQIAEAMGRVDELLFNGISTCKDEQVLEMDGDVL